MLSANVRRLSRIAASGLLVCTLSNTASAADPLGLEPQPVVLQSAGPLAFGPSGVLFVGDPKAATVYAISTRETLGESIPVSEWSATRVDDLRERLAKVASADIESVSVTDIVADPETSHLVIAATVSGKPSLYELRSDGKVEALNLDKVLASTKVLPNPPEDKVTGEGRRASNKRMESITDLAFAEGRVLVSGLSGQDAGSTVLAFDFPFRDTSVGTDIEIYHGAHGRVEENAAVRSFTPLTIGGKPSLLAGFTCTPLVQFSLDQIQSGGKVRGKTVAELGNWNKPLDIVAYEKQEKPYLLVANSARGLMKVDVANIAEQDEISERVPDGGTKGLPFEKLETAGTVTQLAKLADTHCLTVTELPSKQLQVSVMELP